MTTRRRRRMAPATAAFVAAASLTLAPGPVSAGAPCAMETIVLRTFTVELKAKKKVYEIGDTARIDLKVTRPAQQDPLQLGVPLSSPTHEPAAEVNVGVGLNVNRVFLPGFAQTDENGEAVVRIKLEPWVGKGWVAGDGYSWKRQVETTCANVEENGYTHIPKLFKIVR